MKGACKKPHCKDQPHCTEGQITNNKTTTTTEKPNSKEHENNFGDIIAAVERLELEARKEKEELEQRVDLLEANFKGLADDFKKQQQKTEKSLENQLNKLNKFDMSLSSHKVKVKVEFDKRDKSMLYLVSKKFLPYIRSLISRMDGMDEKMKKMEKKADYYGGANWRA